MAPLSEGESLEWEAAQWVARRMGDQPFDEAQFASWAAADPRRQFIFDTMWQRMALPCVDQARSAFAQQRRQKHSLVAGCLGTLLLALGAYQFVPSVELFMTPAQEFAVADGEVRPVELPDGSRLTLAGNARIQVRYTRHGREVELVQGTIFADVARDEHRPFHIKAGDGQVTVLGTRFEVSMKPDSTRVSVESGVVRFGPSGWFKTPIVLQADQGGILSGSEMQRVEHGGHHKVARWRSEWAEYQDVALQQIVTDLDAASPVPIIIANKEVARLKVSGRIRLIDPVKQLHNLAVIHNFSVDQRDDAIILSGVSAVSQPPAQGAPQS